MTNEPRHVRSPHVPYAKRRILIYENPKLKIYAQQSHAIKMDGTLHGRSSWQNTGKVVYIFKDGGKRVYINNVLRYEKLA